VVGAFTITDFCSIVEQALGIEMQLMYTTEFHMSSGGKQSQSQGDKKAIIVVLVTRRGSFNVTRLTMVALLSLVL
jgi:hypothetical protein